MASTEVSILNRITGAVIFYDTYADARTAAGNSSTDSNLIQIWANLNEQILLKDKVDIWIAPGRVLNVTTAKETILDNDGIYTDPVVCKIYGSGIIKNSYSGSSPNTRYECIKIVNSNSKVSIECDYVEGLGKEGATVGGATISVSSSPQFSLKCNKIISHYNSAVVIAGCDDLTIFCNSIESGTATGYNGGTSVMSISASGVLKAQELLCYGHGTCLKYIAGQLNASIKKIKTINSGTTSNPTILLDDGGTQELILYFDSIENLNSIGGDAVKVTEGKAILTGSIIYSYKGYSLYLNSDAEIFCNKIKSDTKGVLIQNSSTQRIFIDSNFIEGSVGASGAVEIADSSNVIIKNARIKNISSSSSSIGMYINPGNGNPTIELDNVIIVTGNLTWGESVYVLTGSEPATYIKNLGLFVNKAVVGAEILIGTETNFKVITNSQIS